MDCWHHAIKKHRMIFVFFFLLDKVLTTLDVLEAEIRWRCEFVKWEMNGKNGKNEIRRIKEDLIFEIVLTHKCV